MTAAPVLPFGADRAVPPRPPISDEIFELYRRQYAYDATPLNATIDATEETVLWTRTTVTFDAAYGGETGSRKVSSVRVGVTRAIRNCHRE